MINLEDIGINKSDNIAHIANLSPSYSFEFESLSSVVKTMLSSEHRLIPILSKKQDLIGIVNYMDILGALLRGLSRNTRISEFMTRHVIFCESIENISSVLQKIKVSRRDGIPLVKGTKLLGMVSEHDFVKLVFGKYLNMPIGKIMSHKPLFVNRDISVSTCMKTMVNTHYRRLPVVVNKGLVGIITGHDILRYLAEVNYNPTLLNESIETIMSTPVINVTEHDDVSTAVELMMENKIGGMPVINEENMVKGIITERDVVEML